MDRVVAVDDPMIDAEAMAEALREGTIAAAGLDNCVVIVSAHAELLGEYKSPATVARLCASSSSLSTTTGTWTR